MTEKGKKGIQTGGNTGVVIRRDVGFIPESYPPYFLTQVETKVWSSWTTNRCGWSNVGAKVTTQVVVDGPRLVPGLGQVSYTPLVRSGRVQWVREVGSHESDLEGRKQRVVVTMEEGNPRIGSLLYILLLYTVESLTLTRDLGTGRDLGRHRQG